MAGGAVPLVERLAGLGRPVGHLPLGELHRPRHLVGVHVEQAGSRIERGAAPLAAAVHPGKQDRALRARRVELAALAQLQPGLADGLGGLRRPRRDQVLGEALPRERRRQRRQDLRGRGLLARHVGRRRPRPPPSGRRARRCRGRARRRGRSSRSARRRRRGRPSLAIVMSEGAAGKSRSQRSCLTAWKCQTRSPVSALRQRIVFANRLSPCRLRAVEVVRGRAGRRVDEAAPLVERHARPRVGAAAVLPRVLRPRLVAGLARVRDGVERPLLRAGVDVEGADVAGRRGQPLGHDRPDDQQVAVEHAGRVQADADRPRVPAQKPSRRSIRPPLPKVATGRARPRVERVQPLPRGEVDPALLAALPVHQPADARARRASSASAFGSKLQRSAPGGRVEREHPQLRRRRVEHRRARRRAGTASRNPRTRRRCRRSTPPSGRPRSRA